MESDKYYNVKITILKKLKVQDIHKEYAKKETPLMCIEGKEGDEYISSNCERPDKFCVDAWEGIKRKVASLATGGDGPYTTDEDVSINCCNDGLHPVIFKLERMEL